MGQHPERMETYLRGLRVEWRNEVLREGYLEVLEVLLSGKLRRVPERRSLARASMISKRFTSHYHHGIPFERRALRRAWDGCREKDCASARRELELEIGALGRGAGVARP